ncbi:MAG: MoxR family ATPase [Spirochaetes bacterium]|nr:MoxR family ATPase [Spirochaetota bacterium]
MADNTRKINEILKVTEKLKNEISKAVIGQNDLIDYLICALIAGGHVLLEGVPGTAKTLTAKVLSRALSLQFKRIQCTPDLMPSDLIGVSVYNTAKSRFEFKKGPLFANIVLADEINRSPAKTQAALIEVMEEKQITVDGTTFRLDLPFFIIATQNPVEFEGTYRLPEAELDRFLMKINVGYPSLENEQLMLETYMENRNSEVLEKIKNVIDSGFLISMQNTCGRIHADKNILKYIAEITAGTRNSPDLVLGASPRASVDLMNSSRAFALMNGRDFVIPEDVKYLSKPVLAHRLITSPEREIEGVTAGDIIDKILQLVEVPR